MKDEKCIKILVERTRKENMRLDEKIILQRIVEK
jgi:hypothetical protein